MTTTLDAPSWKKSTHDGRADEPGASCYNVVAHKVSRRVLQYDTACKQGYNTRKARFENEEFTAYRRIRLAAFLQQWQIDLPDFVARLSAAWEAQVQPEGRQANRALPLSNEPNGPALFVIGCGARARACDYARQRLPRETSFQPISLRPETRCWSLAPRPYHPLPRSRSVF
jgi:hypothetical protein